MLYFDTESIGFYGPTVLIQWAIDDGEIHLHNIFKEPVHKTLALIEMMMEHDVAGYNLTHDSYHINKTYNVLKQLPILDPPDIYEYHTVEVESITKDSYCVKPKSATDFLLIG